MIDLYMWIKKTITFDAYLFTFFQKLNVLHSCQLFLLKTFSHKIWMDKCSKRARSRQIAHARVYGSCARVRARIFTKKNLLVTLYSIKRSLRFCKDPSFCWGDIILFVTMDDLDLEFFIIFKPHKKTQF